MLRRFNNCLNVLTTSLSFPRSQTIIIQTCTAKFFKSFRITSCHLFRCLFLFSLPRATVSIVFSYIFAHYTPVSVVVFGTLLRLQLILCPVSTRRIVSSELFGQSLGHKSPAKFDIQWSVSVYSLITCVSHIFNRKRFTPMVVYFFFRKRFQLGKRRECSKQQSSILLSCLEYRLQCLGRGL